MKLTKDFKKWLYHNLHSFYKNDQYLKHFRADVLLYRVKFLIRDTHTMKDLLDRISNISELNTKFFIFRKMKNNKKLFFIYPSMYIQVKSFFDAWTEISNFEDIVQDVYDIEYHKKREDLNGDEFHEVKSINQFVFGITPSSSTYPKVKKSKSLTFKDYEMSKVTCVRRGFLNEYENFKSAIRQNIRDIEEGFIFQTDLVGFYHSLRISQLISYFEQRDGLPYVVKLLRELKDEGIEELPIGWVLSPFLVYYLLIEVHETLSNRLLLENVSIVPLSYVDDFIFIVNTGVEMTSSQHKQIGQKIMDIVLCIFAELGFSDVCFHKIGADKTKIIPIDSKILSQLGENFFDLLLNSYGDDTEVDWHIIDDLLGPTDNGVHLNENVFLHEVLRNLKRKLSNDEFDQVDFDKLYNKTVYRLEKNNFKYLESFFNILREFFYYKFYYNKLNDEMIHTYVDKISSSIMLKDFSINVYVIFLKGLWNSLPEKYTGKTSVYKSFEQEVFKKFSKSDAEKAFLFFNLIERRIDTFEYTESSSLLTWNRKDVFIPFVSEYQRYSEVYSMFSKRNKEVIKEIDEVEVYLLVNIFIRLDQTSNDFCYISSLELLVRNSKKSQKSTILISFLEESLYYFMPKLSPSCANSIIKMKSFKKSLNEQLYIEMKKFVTFHSLMSDKIEGASSVRRRQFNRFIDSVIKKENNNSVELSEMWKVNYTICTDTLGRRIAIKKLLKSIYSYLSSDLESYQRNLYYGFRDIESNFTITFDSLNDNFNDFSYDVANLIDNVLMCKSNRSFFPLFKKVKKLKSLRSGNIAKVNLDKILNESSNEDGKVVKVVVAPLSFNEDDLLDFKYKEQVKNRNHKKINQAISFSIQNKANFIIFPEMSLPRQFLKSYLRRCSRNNITLIAGLEYRIDAFSRGINEVIISVPNRSRKKVLGLDYWPYIQRKIYPSSLENYCLINSGYTFYQGKNLLLFQSRKFKNFAVLNCADFLSLGLKKSLQGKIQSLFIPAMNYDSTTFEVLAESAARELYCYCCISNNRSFGSSVVLAPFRKKHDRTVFKVEGKCSTPEYHLIEMNIDELDNIQSLNSDVYFDKSEDEVVRKYKQLPSGWKKIGRNRS